MESTTLTKWLQKRRVEDETEETALHGSKKRKDNVSVGGASLDQVMWPSSVKFTPSLLGFDKLPPSVQLLMRSAAKKYFVKLFPLSLTCLKVSPTSLHL